jgi:PKD repeat protein
MKVPLALARRALPAALLAASLSAAGLAADLDGLGEPRTVSPQGRAERAVLTVDALHNAFIAMQVDGKARVAAIGSSFSGDWPLSEIDIPQEAISIEVNRFEVVHVAFAREDNELGARGREIFLLSNLGGDFGLPSNITSNLIDDRSPHMALDPSGAPRLVWVQGDTEGAGLILERRARGPLREVGRGELPAIAVDGAGRSHVAFVDGGALKVVDEEADAFPAPVEIDTIGSGPCRPAIGVDGGGRLAALHISGGELRLVLRAGGSFAAPRILDAGVDGSAGFDARLPDSGRLLIAYIKDGDVHVLRGAPEGVLVPERATNTPEAESSPSAREDEGGNLHLCFIREGAVLYANTATKPAASFTAEPVAGEMPLSVRFVDGSIGEVRAWRWDFGDGSTSTERSPVHTYVAVGTWSVTLEVVGPGGSSTLEKPGLITVTEPSFTMRAGDVSALPGDRDIWVPVIGYHRESVQGFQIVGRVDPSFAEVRELSLVSTLTELYDPEFFALSIPGDGNFTLGLLLDYEAPFDGRKMAPGRDQLLIHIVLEIASDAPPGDSAIELLPPVEAEDLGCIYTVDGFSRIPVLTRGRLRVLPPTSPAPRPFLRGDIDSNGKVEITDAILVLRFLFEGYRPDCCADALDADDSGAIDLGDPVSILLFLYQGGAPTPPPFPVPGLDPTDDGIEPCLR